MLPSPLTFRVSESGRGRSASCIHVVMLATHNTQDECTNIVMAYVSSVENDDISHYVNDIIDIVVSL